MLKEKKITETVKVTGSDRFGFFIDRVTYDYNCKSSGGK